MIKGEDRNKINDLWTQFWTGGVTNPFTVIEQITFLMFSRMLDIKETLNEKKASLTGAEGRRTREALQVSAEKLKPQIEAYEKLCSEIGFNPADVALSWVLNNEVVTSPIVGPRTMEQLEQNVKALEIKLPEDVLKKLDEIWPGPGNQAPEAYAW